MLSPYYTDVTEDRKCKQIFAVAQMFSFPLLPVFGLHWLNTLWKWFSSSPRCKVHCRDGSVPYNVNEKTQEAEIKVTTGGRHWGKSAVSWKCIARAKLYTSCIYFINIKYSATLSHMWMKNALMCIMLFPWHGKVLLYFFQVFYSLLWWVCVVFSFYVVIVSYFVLYMVSFAGKPFIQDLFIVLLITHNRV